jgi:hypothetical protein
VTLHDKSHTFCFVTFYISLVDAKSPYNIIKLRRLVKIIRRKYFTRPAFERSSSTGPHVIKIRRCAARRYFEDIMSIRRDVDVFCSDAGADYDTVSLAHGKER